jgi:hypothetical protein
LLEYGHSRGYLFEIVVISVDWLVLIAGALMAAAVFLPRRPPTEERREVELAKEMLGYLDVGVFVGTSN